MIAADARWHPGIGDPNFTGWLTVLAYGVAALLCAACARRGARADPHWRHWLGLALMMAALGVNKQLDLQSWFTELGRDLARADGWYARRATLQAGFIAALAAGALAASVWLQRRWRDLDPALRCAGAGVLLLLTFIVARAASFHHVDRWLGIELGSRVRLNALVELGGIGLIAAAAGMRRRRPRPAAAPRAATS